jgi:hypothetical protein
MADNPGVYPLDPNTEVGQLRVIIGDTASTPYNPPVVGMQNYTLFSDTELEVYIATNDSLLRAASAAYFALAAQAAIQSKSVKDYDLQVDLTKRSADLRAIAEGFTAQADAEDANSEDAFLIVPTGRNGFDGCYPELSIRPVSYWRC